MKVCTDCKESKSLEEFQKKASSKDGRTGKCKPCKRVYDNEHYKNNPDRRVYIKENQKSRQDTNRAWLIEYLSCHPCVDCGEADIVVLQFDHQYDKKFHVSTMIFTHGLEKIQEEVEKCMVRCANCHTRKTARDFGWAKYLFSSTLP